VDHDLGEAVEGVLSALMDHRLVLRYDALDGQPRMGMLETIREFALERLAASGELEQVQRAHAEYFASLAETPEPSLNSGQRPVWLRRFDAEQANIRAAFEWAVESNFPESAFRILGALWLWCWLSFRGARRWVDDLRARGTGAATGIARARALNAAAILAWGDGDTSAAHALAAEAVGLSRESGNPREVAFGEFADARGHLEASLPALREAHDWKYTGVALIGLGSAARAADDAQAAALAYTEALTLCREAGAAGDVPLCIEGLAAVALHRDQPDVAARLLGAAEGAQAAGFTPTFPGFEQAYRATARLVADVLDRAAFAEELESGRTLALLEVLVIAQRLCATDAAPARTRLPVTQLTGTLSERETQVLRLLARGQSNAEIAVELVLSVRTVEKHVANAYAKIGARGRADAATYALRQGLRTGDVREVLGVWRMRHPHPAGSQHTR
jgi:DNA-binding CsgD family transcriptional regulator